MNKPTITIEQFSKKVIYIRFRGSYIEFRKRSRGMFNELLKFAEKNDLVVPEQTKVLTIYHDNPYVTESDNLRTSVAMTIPEGATVKDSGKITTMTIEGKYGVGHFEISPSEYEEAWHYIYHDWLFKSDEKARDSFPFELYVTEPPKNMKEKSFTDIYIPIE